MRAASLGASLSRLVDAVSKQQRWLESREAAGALTVEAISTISEGLEKAENSFTAAAAALSGDGRRSNRAALLLRQVDRDNAIADAEASAGLTPKAQLLLHNLLAAVASLAAGFARQLRGAPHALTEAAAAQAEEGARLADAQLAALAACAAKARDAAPDAEGGREKGPPGAPARPAPRSRAPPAASEAERPASARGERRPSAPCDPEPSEARAAPRPAPAAFERPQSRRAPLPPATKLTVAPAGDLPSLPLAQGRSRSLMVGLGGTAACAGTEGSFAAAPPAQRSASTEAPRCTDEEGSFGVSRAARALSASLGAADASAPRAARPSSKGRLDVIVPLAAFPSATPAEPPPGLRTRLQRKLSFNRAVKTPDRGGRKQQYLTPVGASVLSSAGPL